MVTVRRIRPADADGLRTVRLGALAESPEAFAMTLEAEADLPREHWQRWAAEGATGEERATFVAVADRRFIGTVAGSRSEAASERAHLIAMWVEPGHRSAGTGARLGRAVIDWARDAGYTVVSLWVVVGNDAARTLYGNLGFVATDDAQPLPSQTDLVEQRWELPLDYPRTQGSSACIRASRPMVSSGREPRARARHSDARTRRFGAQWPHGSRLGAAAGHIAPAPGTLRSHARPPHHRRHHRLHPVPHRG